MNDNVAICSKITDVDGKWAEKLVFNFKLKFLIQK